MTDDETHRRRQLLGKSRLEGAPHKTATIVISVITATAVMAFHVFRKEPGASAGAIIGITFASIMGMIVAGYFTHRDGASGYGGHPEEPPPSEKELLDLFMKNRGSAPKDEQARQLRRPD